MDRSFATAVGADIVRAIDGKTYSWSPLTLPQIGNFNQKLKAIKVAEAKETIKELTLSPVDSATVLTQIKATYSRFDAIYEYVYLPDGCLDVFASQWKGEQPIPAFSNDTIIGVVFELVGIKLEGQANAEPKSVPNSAPVPQDAN